MKLLVVLCSVRDGRRGKLVVDWFLPIVENDGRFKVKFADLADYDMPLKMTFKEPSERNDKKYPIADVQKWSDAVDSSDAYIFITPEYNHGAPAALKNAIDQIYWEWLDKPAGFVGYGSHGASDSIDSLKHTAKALKWKQVSGVGIEQVKQAFDESGGLIERDRYEAQAKKMLDELASFL
jgi:NAD(P)H-dependent FMN reductase